jgi:hypothetical protein
MWGEGASDLWGHLEGEDAVRLKAIRERLGGKSARLDDGTSNIDRSTPLTLCRATMYPTS